MKHKTLVISENIHEKMKKYCKEKKIKISEYVEKLIENDINIDDSELPLILKNSNNEIVETIICNDISSEIKNNMPRFITLLKETKDGSGYIGNYTLK